MINFEPITLSDKPIIDNCLKNNIFRSCNLCFTNLVAWRAKFKTCFAVVDETLFVRYQEENGENCYFLPIGKMPLKESLALIIKDAEINNISLIMKVVSDQMWECVECAMPNTFQFLHDRGNDEYIYLAEKLITLKGKKLQSKRNHINHFKAENSDWNYSPISTVKELQECSVMLDEWENLNISKAEESLRYDYIAIKMMLENFHYLQLCGGIIRVGGKIVAFTIGERLTDDTFVIHVEKAFANIHGAYSIVNQQFAELGIGSIYTYINREEDMGLEYLRKAKMSYYPDILLPARILRLK